MPRLETGWIGLACWPQTCTISGTGAYYEGSKERGTNKDIVSLGLIISQKNGWFETILNSKVSRGLPVVGPTDSAYWRGIYGTYIPPNLQKTIDVLPVGGTDVLLV